MLILGRPSLRHFPKVRDLVRRPFGTPDGVFYGPYTADQYLTQKGFVTVCRVGALTGYNQNHPLIIYAQQGRWERNNDVGAVNSTYSFIVPSGSFTNGYSGSVALTNVTASTSGSITSGSATLTFINPTFEFTFQSGASTASTSVNPTGSTSGSLLFNGQIANFPTVSASYVAGVYFSGPGTINTGSVVSLFASASVFTGSFVSGTSVTSGGKVINLAAYGTDPFDGFCATGVPPNTAGPINLVSSSFYINNTNNCASPTINLYGYVSGSFGKYNGAFQNDSVAPSINNCGVLITGSGITKILAVLNDTQAGGLDSQLNAPGFSGSYLISSSVLTSTSSSINQQYSLILSSSNGNGWGSYNFSLNNGATDYITNTFGANPSAGNPTTQVAGQKIEAAYLYSIFQDTIASITAAPDDWAVFVASPIQINNSTFSGSVQPLQFTDQYSLNPTVGDSAFSLSNATSPWIVSQAVAGVNGQSYRFELFRFATLGDGTNTNTAYKIEISNVKLAGTVPGTNWGTFTVGIRSFGDTENRPIYLETYNNVTLDPMSPNYISRLIGDKYSYITADGKVIEFGEYSNISNRVRVIMTNNNYPVGAVPYGFEALYVPFGGLAIDNITPPVIYTKASTSTVSPGKFASGITFGTTLTADPEIVGLYPTGSGGEFVYQDNLQYFAPLPAGATVGSNVGFYLDTDYTGNGVGTSSFISANNLGYINAIPATITSNETTYVKMRRFVTGMQGGFDGQSPAIPINIGSNIIAGNTQGLNCAMISSPGSVAYAQCLGALGNADIFNIDLIALPGIFHSLHSYVAQSAIDLCEQRGDCFYIMDNVVFPSTNQTTGMINAVINDVSTIDSSYVGTYYPWVRILDTNLNQIVSVPPSVVMPAVYASSDAASAEWYAPAGLNRGGITQATGLLDKLTNSERDLLYTNRINPITTLSGEIVAWGQKTLQIANNDTNRINVRRLLINLKKFIGNVSMYLVFEQNVADTWNRFLGVVNPYLESVQQRSGLYAFQVVMDSTTNSADVIDQNIMYGRVVLQTTRVSELLIVDFSLAPTGASFSN
jgi:hypothetical protein